MTALPKPLLIAGAAMLVTGCDAPRLVGFPGMTVAEFNRVNEPLGIAVDPTQSDWQGFNAPHMLVLQKEGRSIEIPVLDTGGGTQIRSTGGDHTVPPSRISSLSFDIGRGYERLVDSTAKYIDYCRALERWAGVAPQNLPDAAMLESELARHPGPLREAIVCSANGPEFGYNITVVHHDGHRDGGDYSLAGANGTVLLELDRFVANTVQSREGTPPQPPVAKRTR